MGAALAPVETLSREGPPLAAALLHIHAQSPEQARAGCREQKVTARRPENPATYHGVGHEAIEGPRGGRPRERTGDTAMRASVACPTLGAARRK